MQIESPARNADNARSLHDLQGAHENLLAWMWALDDLTQQETPRRGQLETVRWFLGQARRDRRLALESIYARIPTLDPDRARAVKSVRTLTYETLAAGSRHIAKWTIDAVEADWAGYCAETREMRDLWLRAVESEKQILYPLLDHGLMR